MDSPFFRVLLRPVESLRIFICLSVILLLGFFFVELVLYACLSFFLFYFCMFSLCWFVCREGSMHCSFLAPFDAIDVWCRRPNVISRLGIFHVLASFFFSFSCFFTLY